MWGLQEVVQSVETTPYEVEVTSSNPPSPSCVDMSKKKKKKKLCRGEMTLNKCDLIWFKTIFLCMPPTFYKLQHP
jgi:hypothetical protein